MSKPVGARRLTRFKVAAVLGGCPSPTFTDADLKRACQAAEVKYDTIQRAIQRLDLARCVGRGVYRKTGALIP